MTQTIQRPATAVRSSRSSSAVDSPSVSGSLPVPLIAAQHQADSSIIDLCKVVAFLVLAMIARYALTHQHTSQIDGASEPPAHVDSLRVVRSLDLMDLSTVGF